MSDAPFDPPPPPYAPWAGVPPPPPAQPASPPRRRAAGGIGAGVAAALVLLGKLKFLALLVKAPFALSMLLSLFVYAQIFGPAVGLGFLLLLFVHEMGHLVMIRRAGIAATLPMFIPFMGAFIALKENPRDVLTEARIALGGPVLGTVGAMVCLALYQLGAGPVFLYLAYFGFFLNLFNLIPLSPLDGGRILSAVSVWANVAGLAIAAAFFLFFSPNPLLLLIIVIGGLGIRGRLRAVRENPEYYRISSGARTLVGLAYFGLAAFLAIALHLSVVELGNRLG